MNPGTRAKAHPLAHGMAKTMRTSSFAPCMFRAACRAQLVSLAVLAACTRSPDAKGVEPAPQATSAAVAVQPEPAAVPSPANEPAKVEPAAPAPEPAPAAAPAAEAAPSPERALFDIIERLVKEPTALAELAPNAKIQIYGVKDVKKHKITDAKAELGWLFDEEHAVFAPPGVRLIDIRGTAIKCDASALTCKVGYGGGETSFTFARQGEKVVLAEVISQLN